MSDVSFCMLLEYAVNAVILLYVCAAFMPLMTPVRIPLSSTLYPNVDSVSIVAFVWARQYCDPSVSLDTSQLATSYMIVA